MAVIGDCGLAFAPVLPGKGSDVTFCIRGPAGLARSEPLRRLDHERSCTHTRHRGRSRDPQPGAGYLLRQGFRVDVGDGGAALDRFRTTFGEPDLVVLDLMLPGEDGLSICRRLRATSRVPVLMLTAKGEEIDRIVGLEMGADDYLPKPFNPRELVARIRAILRRAEPPAVAHRRLAVGDLIVDLDARSATRAGAQPVELTSAEFDLLECFVTRPGRVLSREQLMDLDARAARRAARPDH